jgi:hypothetical protein
VVADELQELGVGVEHAAREVGQDDPHHGPRRRGGGARSRRAPGRADRRRATVGARQRVGGGRGHDGQYGVGVSSRRTATARSIAPASAASLSASAHSASHARTGGADRARRRGTNASDHSSLRRHAARSGSSAPCLRAVVRRRRTLACRSPTSARRRPARSRSPVSSHDRAPSTRPARRPAPGDARSARRPRLPVAATSSDNRRARRGAPLRTTCCWYWRPPARACGRRPGGAPVGRGAAARRAAPGARPRGAGGRVGALRRHGARRRRRARRVRAYRGAGRPRRGTRPPGWDQAWRWASVTKQVTAVPGPPSRSRRAAGARPVARRRSARVRGADGAAGHDPAAAAAHLGTADTPKTRRAARTACRRSIAPRWPVRAARPTATPRPSTSPRRSATARPAARAPAERFAYNNCDYLVLGACWSA